MNMNEQRAANGIGGTRKTEFAGLPCQDSGKSGSVRVRVIVSSTERGWHSNPARKCRHLIQVHRQALCHSRKLFTYIPSTFRIRFDPPSRLLESRSTSPARSYPRISRLRPGCLACWCTRPRKFTYVRVMWGPRHMHCCIIQLLHPATSETSNLSRVWAVGTGNYQIVPT